MEKQNNNIWRNLGVQRNSDAKLYPNALIKFQRFSSKGSKRSMQVEANKKFLTFQPIVSKLKNFNSFDKSKTEKDIKITPRAPNLSKTGKISHKHKKTQCLTDNSQVGITQPQSKENLFLEYEDLMKQMQNIYELFLNKLNKTIKNVKMAYQEQMAKITMNTELLQSDKKSLTNVKIIAVKIGQILSNSLEIFENTGLFGNEIKFVAPNLIKKFKSLNIDNKQFLKISTNIISRHSLEIKRQGVLSLRQENKIVQMNKAEKIPESKCSIQNIEN